MSRLRSWRVLLALLIVFSASHWSGNGELARTRSGAPVAPLSRLGAAEAAGSSDLLLVDWTASSVRTWNRDYGSAGSGDGRDTALFSGSATMRLTPQSDLCCTFDSELLEYHAAASYDRYDHTINTHACGYIELTTNMGYAAASAEVGRQHFMTSLPVYVLANNQDWRMGFPFESYTSWYNAPSRQSTLDMSFQFASQYADHASGAGCTPSSSSDSAAGPASFASLLHVLLDSTSYLGPDATIYGDPTGTTFTGRFQHSYRTMDGLEHTIVWGVSGRRIAADARVDLVPELDEQNIFWPGVSLENVLDAHLTCDDPAGCVLRFIRQNNQGTNEGQVSQAKTGRYPNRVDVGSLPAGQTRVTAQARAGREGPPDTITLRVCDQLPEWTQGVAVTARKMGKSADYQFKRSFPDPPWDFSVDVPKWVPFVGGKVGLDKTSGEVSVKVQGAGKGTVSGSWSTGITAGDNFLEGSATVTGAAEIDEKLCLKVLPSNFKLDVGGGKKFKRSVLDLLSSSTESGESLVRYELRGTPGLDQIVSFLKSTEIEYGLKPNVSIDSAWGLDQAGKLEFKDGSATPGINAFANGTVKLPDLLPLDLSVKGSADTTLTVTFPPFKLKEIVTKGGVAASAKLYNLFSKKRNVSTPSIGFDCTWTWTTGQGACSKSSKIVVSASAAPVIQQRWTAPTVSTRAIAPAPADAQLATGLYDQAYPSLAVSSTGRRLLTWSYERPEAGAFTGNELYSSTSIGSSQPWVAGSPATSDSQDDFNRELVFLNNGNALAVFERFDTASPPDPATDASGYLSRAQVAAARWDSASATWGAPRQLSTSGSLNFRPQAGATNPGAIAVWAGNPANQFIGDTTSPSSVYFATYAAASDTWSAPGTVLTGQAGLLEYRLATTGTQAALVYVLDTDANLATSSDRELYSTLWNGSAWSSPVRLTNNSIADDTPRLALAGNGQPQLIWNQGGQLRFLSGGWDTSQSSAIGLPDAAGAAGLRLASGTDGTLALAWPQPTPTDTRIGYAIYDPANQRWSEALSLAPNVTGAISGTTSMVANLSPALESGRLLLAYQLVTGTIGTAPDADLHSLRYAELPIGRNLSVSAGSVSATPAAPGQAITITAVVSNTGQLAVPTFEVGLMRGTNPTPVVIGTLGMLPAGQAVTITLPFIQPATGTDAYSILVDPRTQLQETTRADNSAAIAPTWELIGQPTQATPNGLVVAAAATPRGLAARDAITIALRADGLTGPVVGTTLIAVPVTTSQAVTATALISATQLGQGRHLVYWQSPAGEVLAASRADVLPDLTTRGESIVFGTDPGASAPVSLLVWNRGSWASSGGRVAIYDRDPALAGPRELGSIPLPAISAGSFVSVTGTLNLTGSAASSTGLSVIYVQVDPDNAVDEANERDNVVAAGHVTGSAVSLPRVSLPVVMNGSSEP